MCDVAKLKGKMAEKEMTQEGLAQIISIDRSTLNRKLRTGGSFTIGEANKIVSALGLSKNEAMQIFFPSMSH